MKRKVVVKDETPTSFYDDIKQTMALLVDKKMRWMLP